MIEAVVGRPASDVQVLVDLIARTAQQSKDRADFEARINPQTAAAGVQFNHGHPIFRSVPAPGYADPDGVVINTPEYLDSLEDPERMSTLLGHELVHAEQMDRAKGTGDVQAMHQSASKAIMPQGPQGPVDRKAYYQNKQEIMARAHDMVTSALRRGKSPEEIRSRLKHLPAHSQVHDQPQLHNRFLKYASQYLDQEENPA